MYKITSRDKIRSVAARWEIQYKRYMQGQQDKLAILESIKKLDLNTCSAKDVDDIIGNQSWSKPFCDECNSYKESVISFDCGDGESRICADCLEKATLLLK